MLEGSGLLFKPDAAKLPWSLAIVEKLEGFDVHAEGITLCTDASPNQAILMLAMFTRVFGRNVEKANAKIKTILKY